MKTEDKATKNAAKKKTVSPNTYKERAMYQILKTMFGNVRFGITDDLFELGLTEEQTEKLVSEVTGQGIPITGEDVRKYRTIEKIVQGTDRTCRWDSPFVPEKPVLVLVHGVSPESFFLPILPGLKDRFSLLTIEPIVEQMQYVFENERITEVIDFYSDLIMYYLPEGAKVYGFLGHSFGGDIAYRLAVRWMNELGEHPYVYMIDTYMRAYDADHYEEYKKQLLSRFDPKTKAEVSIYMKMCAYCFDVAKKLGDGKVLPPYDGPVRLFSAIHVKEDPTLAAVLPDKAIMLEDNPNVEAWENLVSDLTVDYVNGDHLTIVSVPGFSEVFFHRLDRDLAKR